MKPRLQLATSLRWVPFTQLVRMGRLLGVCDWMAAPARDELERRIAGAL